MMPDRILVSILGTQRSILLSWASNDWHETWFLQLKLMLFLGKILLLNLSQLLFGTLCRELKDIYGVDSNRDIPEWGKNIFSSQCLIMRCHDEQDREDFIEYLVAMVRVHLRLAAATDPLDSNPRQVISSPVQCFVPQRQYSNVVSLLTTCHLSFLPFDLALLCTLMSQVSNKPSATCCKSDLVRLCSPHVKHFASHECYDLFSWGRWMHSMPCSAIHILQ